MRLFFLFLFMIAPFTAHAAQPCQNPAGDEGDQVYNITYHVMQYCNGQHWVAMGSIAEQGDNLGDHTAGQAINMSGFRIENLGAPNAGGDAATKTYADTKVSKAGDTMTGALNLSGSPTANAHATTKEYVDIVVASASGGGSGAIHVFTKQGTSATDYPACPSGWSSLQAGVLTIPFTGNSAISLSGNSICYSGSDIQDNNGYLSYRRVGNSTSNAWLTCRVCIKD